MSAVTKAIGLAKKLKHRYQDEIRARTPVYLSPVRRIERVSLPQRVCAMTFDDGPCRLPANPSSDGTPLTLSLLESLEAFGAHGTFDIVGDTPEKRALRPGAASDTTTTPIFIRTPTAVRFTARSLSSAFWTADTKSPATPTVTSSMVRNRWSTAAGSRLKILPRSRRTSGGSTSSCAATMAMRSDSRARRTMWIAPKTALPATTRTHCSATSISRQASTAQAGCRLRASMPR